MSEPITVSRSHSKLNFSIHPLARDAYQWTLSYPKLIQWHNLPNGLAKQLLLQPLHGVMVYQKQGKSNGAVRKSAFQLCAPLWPALYWEAPHPPEGTLLIHNTSSHIPRDEDIEREAWASALSLLALSVNSKDLAPLRESFQTLLPRHLARHFFNKDEVTDVDLCRWTERSRGTLGHQRRRSATKVPTTEFIGDPIDLLAADWEPSNER